MMIDKLASRFHCPVFLGRGVGRRILAACTYYFCAIWGHFNRGVGKDRVCIRKWITRLALNSCSPLLYVSACLCVGSRKKKSRNIRLDFRF